MQGVLILAELMPYGLQTFMLWYFSVQVILRHFEERPCVFDIRKYNLGKDMGGALKAKIRRRGHFP